MRVSFLNSSDVSNVDTGRGTFSQREDGIAAAITGGYVENQVDVYIGAHAQVSAGDDITISAEAAFPYDIPDGKAGWLKRFFDPSNVDLGTFTDKFNYNLGIQNAFFTSWAEAIATAQDKAYGGMLNVLITNTHNYASIGSGAQVVAGGAVQVLTDTDNDTINFVGSPIGPFFNASARHGRRWRGDGYRLRH